MRVELTLKTETITFYCDSIGVDNEGYIFRTVDETYHDTFYDHDEIVAMTIEGQTISLSPLANT